MQTSPKESNFTKKSKKKSRSKNNKYKEYTINDRVCVYKNDINGIICVTCTQDLNKITCEINKFKICGSMIFCLFC